MTIGLGQVVAGADTTKVRTSTEGPEFPVGARIKTLGESGTSTGEYIYVKAGAALTAGKVYAIGNDFTCTTGVGATYLGYYAGIPQVDIAQNGYGWVQIDGDCDNIWVLSGCSAASALYTSATAGALDDVASSQARLEGLVMLDAQATAAAATAGHIVGPLKVASSTSS